VANLIYVIDVIVAPVSLHIAMAKVMLIDNVKVASQNVSMYGTGAYTGEIAAEHLVDFGLEWTLVGHSERRGLFNEDDATVAKKVGNALDAGLSVILCIGESLEHRESGSTNDILQGQLDAVKTSVKDWSKIVVAYEPVWAIGTGKTATPEMAQETHAFIRSWINDNVTEEAAAATRIIYGGSVNDKNAKDLIGQADLDGFLVGGASLTVAFKTIVGAANDHHGTQ
jgi:triosephosphate isomerase